MSNECFFGPELIPRIRAYFLYYHAVDPSMDDLKKISEDVNESIRQQLGNSSLADLITSYNNDGATNFSRAVVKTIIERCQKAELIHKTPCEESVNVVLAMIGNNGGVRFVQSCDKKPIIFAQNLVVDANKAQVMRREEAEKVMSYIAKIGVLDKNQDTLKIIGYVSAFDKEAVF